MTIQVTSALGTMAVDAATGQVLNGPQNGIVRVDLDDFCVRNTRDKATLDGAVLNINGLGYWLASGTYEPFDQGFLDALMGASPSEHN